MSVTNEAGRSIEATTQIILFGTGLTFRGSVRSARQIGGSFSYPHGNAVSSRWLSFEPVRYLGPTA
jgi:hypothetical protein